MSTELHPIGPELARRNRRILAERLHWPDGALEACEAIDAEYPGWHTSWLRGGDMSHPEPGYYARRGRGSRDPGVYADTVDELRTAIATCPPSPW